MDPIRRLISRHVAFPLMLAAWSLPRRGGFRPLAQFRLHERLARSEPAVWRAFRDRRLRAALESALRHIPFYEPVASRLLPLAGADPMAALEQFPVITKRTMQEREEALLADFVPRGGRGLHSTSGSTAEPTRFWLDHRRIVARTMSGCRDLAYTGWRPSDPGALIEVVGSMFWNHGRLRRLLNRLGPTYAGLEVNDINPVTARDFLAEMESLRPVYLRGLPSALDEFTGLLEAGGLEARARALGLRGIVANSEMLLSDQRERFERAFGTRVFDLYGSNETGATAMECSAHQGLHVDADVLVLEVLDDDDRAVPRGESGRIVVTDPWNLGYSMIRVDLGDVGHYLPDDGPCPCGVTFPRIAPVEGRTMDFLTLPDGQRLHGLRIAGYLSGALGVRQYRVVQEAPDEVVLFIAGDPAGAEKALERVRDHMPPGLRLRVEFCDEIPRTLGGKRLLVVSRLPKGPP